MRKRGSQRKPIRSNSETEEKMNQQRNHTLYYGEHAKTKREKKRKHQIKIKIKAKTNTRKKRTDTLTTGSTWNNFVLTPHIKLLIYLIKWQAMCQCKISTE